MELDQIKELIEMMKANDLCELEIVDGQTRIALKRGSDVPAAPVVAITSAVMPEGVGNVPAANSASTGTALPAETIRQENLLEVTSPMVGTYFSAPSPNADTFVEIGSKIEKDQVVCIIEAMKVMNEIKSEVAGTVKEILVSNGSSVEFGQPILLVEP
ncbi:MAG: acetyl-CoA carboxylase biotin carboxyl carrier protein [Sedimentisphaerales bacterium]|nr:acetyl-CoA carboxylase biotin carboxyl carrier protein [Sedimentisphaerales bacterium]